MQAFDQLPKDGSTGLPSNATMQQFMATFFASAGSDFNQISPSDFSSEPKSFLPNVTDPGVRSWALAVNGLWQDLVREVRLMQSYLPHQLWDAWECTGAAGELCALHQTTSPAQHVSAQCSLDG